MSAPLNEQQYYEHASATLHALLDALDAVSQQNNEVFEVELANDILTLDFPDAVRFVINSHRAARQIWMAANTSAWHFNWHPDTQTWLCSKSNAELWHVVAEQLNRKTGQTFVLRR